MRLVLRLGVADQDRIAQQSPIAADDRRSGDVAAGDKGDAALLHVGNHAVRHQIPDRPQPHRRDVALGPVKRRGEMVDHRRRARQLRVVRIVRRKGAAVVARAGELALGGRAAIVAGRQPGDLGGGGRAPRRLFQADGARIKGVVRQVGPGGVVRIAPRQNPALRLGREAFNFTDERRLQRGRILFVGGDEPVAIRRVGRRL